MSHKLSHKFSQARKALWSLQQGFGSAAAAAAAVAGSTCPALRFDQGRVWTCQAFFENTRYIQQLVDMSHMITPHLSVVHTWNKWKTNAWGMSFHHHHHYLVYIYSFFCKYCLVPRLSAQRCSCVTAPIRPFLHEKGTSKPPQWHPVALCGTVRQFWNWWSHSQGITSGLRNQ